MTLDQLKAMQEALLSARYNGVLSIKAGDKLITYKSDAEMRAALSSLGAEMGRLSGKPRARSIRTVCGKGL